jgi:hypothetical protein
VDFLVKGKEFEEGRGGGGDTKGEWRESSLHFDTKILIQ